MATSTEAASQDVKSIGVDSVHQSVSVPKMSSLKTCSGDEVTVYGELSVTVEYEEQKVTLPLLVVKGGGQSLLGRDWSSS
jgi:hypothetical protein